jgi:hypothetical protein
VAGKTRRLVNHQFYHKHSKNPIFVAFSLGRDGRGQPSGIYYYQVTTNDTVLTEKMMLLK